MTKELKLKIIDGVIIYAKQNDISNNDIARLSGVNPAYVSNMMRKIFETKGADKAIVPIGDKWFYKLADWAGIHITKNYWETIPTPEFVAILSVLEAARRDSKIAMIIDETGFGKTYTIDKYCNKHPLHTYKITVSRVHKLQDILREICDKLGIWCPSNNSLRLRDIIEKFREIKLAGHKPQLIIDEAENSKIALFQMLKGLYDGVNGYASVVLIGTSQLTNTLRQMRMRDKNGIPQFYRRVKAGIRNIKSVKNFTAFFDKYKVDKELRKLLNALCDNYGELHDYLEPALREADENEVQLTEDFFRIMYDLPKTNLQ